jgi:ATP phosphoribosyltransferase
MKKLTMALPTGRIFKETASLLRECGIAVPERADAGRRLSIEAGELVLLLVKDRDVPTYVEHGVADLGVVGFDVLSELGPDLYQPLDLGIGSCRMVVARSEARPREFYRDLPVVRVATKYPNVARRYFHGHGLPVEVIPLAGSVELAPLLGLSDCIVDLVQSGETLEANGLVEERTLFESTARLVIHRASYRLRTEAVNELCERLSSAAERA